ncbi:MAG: cob(I)yrinic acid a,c-diamide adenosyltransferase [Bacteroidetes bacterium]|jgi:ATP:cob(I)alamin adenosyltransferase|nr:cob(I)yrinic acid a,c-diamide adenosyltransferase [Bacteroidota bacterium]
MRVYTRTGDKGKTGIFGGLLVDKDDIRIECNGKLDEVNSTIGLLRVKIPMDHPWQEKLHKIQVDMMDMMSHIATHSRNRDENTINRPTDGEQFCEQWIDEMLNSMDDRHDFFILPGGNEVAALCHMIRTRMRTAERRLVSLNKVDAVEDFIRKYINRLSDLFFVLARNELYNSGLTEEKLRPFRR